MKRCNPVTRNPATGIRLRLFSAVAVLAVAAGCTQVQDGLSKLTAPRGERTANETDAGAPTTTRLVERDVEAPEIFQVTEDGLWDGRPSLGGVWVAHPDVTDPERVIIRNATNDRFVIGALFRRERDIPGPRIQASSDAAAALGLVPGAPVRLSVTALRREEVADPAQTPQDQAVAEATAPERPPAPATPPKTDVITAAAASLAPPARPAPTTAPASAPASAPARAAATTPAASPARAPQPSASTAASPLSKPYIQIGIFSVEANATRTAAQTRAAGMATTVFAQTSNGKPFWRVVVGPAQSSKERARLVSKAREIGFTDAYAVTN